MKLIILEGIATSGKTTIRNKLSEELLKEGKACLVVGEDETLMPMLNNKDEKVGINFLKVLLNRIINKKFDFIIFDRLLFTHVLMTSSSLDKFKEIEDMIRKEALIIFLQVDELRIPERIKMTKEYRDKEWSEHLNKKGNEEKINSHYINQQRKLLNLLDKTSLEYKVYDTSDMKFDDVVKDILLIK
jgi:thymidylate kinase